MTISKTLIPGGGGDYTLMSTAESTDQQTLSEPYELICSSGTIDTIIKLFKGFLSGGVFGIWWGEYTRK